MIGLLPQAAQHRLPSGTVRFEGRELGSPVSLFLVRAAPGNGSTLHVHPYCETWVVRRGEAEFTVGAHNARAREGDIVVGPANVPHRFVNVGTDVLELVCIHASDTIRQRNIQPDLEDQGERA